MPLANDVPLTPLSFLRRSADVFGDRTGVVSGDGSTVSWAAFHAKADALADAVRAHGTGPDERVAILARNTTDLLAAHYGVPGGGASLIALNTRLSPEEYLTILDDSGARLLLLDPFYADLIAPVVDRLPVDLVVALDDDVQGATTDLTDTAYRDWAAAAVPSGGMAPPSDERAPISVNYTSGTTGRPKGAIYTHRGAYLNSLGMALQMRLTADSAYLWTLPMFHCNGWCFTWAVTAVSATHVCLPKFDAQQALALADEHEITHLCGAPVVLNDMAAVGSTVDLSHGVIAATGGAPPTPRVIETLRSMGVDVVHLYGLTETYGPTAICQSQHGWKELDADEYARKAARQGVRTVNVEQIRVVDDNLVDVPPDGETMGEIVVRSNTVTAGYLNAPDATRRALSGGWLHTGDLAVMHPDGYLEIRDRRKDIIISGGENVSSIEVENVVAAHPAVNEVAVVAAPHPRWGEVPVAFVSLRTGEHASEEELIEFVRQRLAHFKAPKAVRFVELPKTSTGKVQKFELRKAAADVVT